MTSPVRKLLVWALAYGPLAFAAGFVFGALRELVLIPAFGERTGRLAEFPVATLAACAIGAWVGRRTDAPALALGVLGVLVLVALESTLALGLVRMSLREYLAGYDLTHGALFPIGLALMAVAPLLGRRLKPR
ncbi:MAG: hypothetical protein WEA77_02840 [Hyphomonas sp.]|uniref:hypothetical protein n=1 Tax=Hyphomonas sp. TaxID=87 RepID=UPI0034A0134D